MLERASTTRNSADKYHSDDAAGFGKMTNQLSTQTTLIVGKTTFDVELTGSSDTPYKLTAGKRVLYLTRNVPKPHLLFPIGDGKNGRLTMPKWWVIEQNGMLRHLR